MRFENGTKTATINCKQEAERSQNSKKTVGELFESEKTVVIFATGSRDGQRP